MICSLARVISMTRGGLRRLPVLTLAVFAATLAVNLVQASVHGTLRNLERTPAGLHGDWWRSVTSLFVQDGGVAGTALNLAGLLVVGAMAEQVLSRRWWLAQYFGVGIATEFVGYAWQPIGGGNSIAVCGLAGALAVGLWRNDPRLPAFADRVAMLWAVAMLATLSKWAWVPAVVVGSVLNGVAQVLKQQRTRVQRLFAVVVPVIGVILAACQNIHGAALLFGVALTFSDLIDRHNSVRS